MKITAFMTSQFIRLSNLACLFAKITADRGYLFVWSPSTVAIMQFSTPSQFPSQSSSDSGYL